MKILAYIISILITASAFAQKTGSKDGELGLFGGVGWYNGDLNPGVMFGKDFMKPAFGISYRKNLNQRYAINTAFTATSLYGDDRLASAVFQHNRNLNFSTRVYELSSRIEFNFLNFDALNPRYPFSPYIFIGLGMFYFNPTTELGGNVYELKPLQTEGKKYSSVSVCLPFGYGFKWAWSDRLIFYGEWGMRKTYTDYLDNVSGRYPLAGSLSGLSEDLADLSLEHNGPDGTNWGTQRGNSKSKDWYSVVCIGLSFRIGPAKGSCRHLQN